MFAGLSSLRKAEKKEPSKQDKALQDYLNRQYGDGLSAEDTQRKKKKKKQKQQGHAAIAIVDSDISALPPVTEAAAKPLTPDFAVGAANSEGQACCCASLLPCQLQNMLQCISPHVFRTCR